MTTPISEAARQAAERIVDVIHARGASFGPADRAELERWGAGIIQRAIDQVAPAWRPIEAAPRDRTRLLLRCLVRGGPEYDVFIGYWSGHVWIADNGFPLDSVSHFQLKPKV